MSVVGSKQLHRLRHAGRQPNGWKGLRLDAAVGRPAARSAWGKEARLVAAAIPTDAVSAGAVFARTDTKDQGRYRCGCVVLNALPVILRSNHLRVLSIILRRPHGRR